MTPDSKCETCKDADLLSMGAITAIVLSVILMIIIGVVYLQARKHEPALKETLHRMRRSLRKRKRFLRRRQRRPVKRTGRSTVVGMLGRKTGVGLHPSLWMLKARMTAVRAVHASVNQAKQGRINVGENIRMHVSSRSIILVLYLVLNMSNINNHLHNNQCQFIELRKDQHAHVYVLPDVIR